MLRIIVLVWLLIGLMAASGKALAVDVDSRIMAISRPQAAGTFTQKRTFKGMSKPLVSSGDFAYQQHKGLLWRTTAPIEHELFADQKGVRATALGSTQVLTGKMEEKVTQLIFALLAMDINQLQSDFNLATRWQGARWQLDLTPKSALMAAALTTIVITGSERLEHLQLTTAQGDITDIHFESDSAPAAVAKLTQWLKQ